MIFLSIYFINNETNVVLLLSMLKDYFKRECISFLGLLCQKYHKLSAFEQQEFIGSQLEDWKSML